MNAFAFSNVLDVYMQTVIITWKLIGVSAPKYTSMRHWHVYMAYMMHSLEKLLIWLDNLDICHLHGDLLIAYSTIVPINSLWPIDAIWRQGCGSALAQVMAFCLTSPSHYLNQCWLIISKIQLHSSDGNFIRYISHQWLKLTWKLLS